ncbi:MAG TPA: ABC transporter substrate-binding protein [Acidimicrobiales bacterium]|jgi:iron complex transport system substrate-binding protein|nr:ABC transporter substrate-binding protein [Acidimicrobiales bacterium]|tara:strand:+ start:238 stop:1215 length:978 start_codon:yes stop_codon:yes gene_type:complete
MKKLGLLTALSLILVSCTDTGGRSEPITREPDAAVWATETPTEGSTTEKKTSAANEDDVNSDSVVGSYPTAIVSLSPTATEMLFAVGAGEQVIAVDNYSYWPPEAPVVEDLAGWNPNVEAVATLEPDLVILSDSGIQQELESLGIKVYVAAAAAELGDVYAQMLEIGEVTGQQGGAIAAVDKMKEEINTLLDGITRPDNPLTYYHELDDTLYSVTSSTFVGYIYSLAGLINIADPADSDGSSWGYPQLTQEFVLESDPDIIFFADAECCGQSIETIASRPGWSELKAVRNGNVIEINNDVSSRWGPRLVDFLATVSAAVSAAKVE